MGELEIRTLEDLYESIGGFGKFQFFAVLAIALVEIPAALIFTLPLFVGVSPESWTCEDSSGKVTVIPGTAKELLCACNGTLLGGDTSIISEWNLVCEYAWVADFITSVQMAGMLCGGILGAQIVDWFGRKKTLYSCCLIMLCMGCSSAFLSSPFLYATCRFFYGSAASTFLLLATIYPMELLTPRWRALCGAVGPWSEGIMGLALLAYYVHPWKTLTWAASIPMALTLLTYPFLPESPRWLLSKGKLKEAKHALDKIARWNGHEPIKEGIVHMLADSTPNPDESIQEAPEKKQRSGYIQVLINPKLRFKILAFSGIWFAISLIYYAIMFNVKNLSGNSYLNVVYLGLFDAVGFRSAALVNNLFGRRKALLSYMVLGTAPLLVIIAMELDIGLAYDSTWVNFLGLTAKLFIGGGWAAVKCFTGESFPTSCRSTAFGFMTVASSLGGILGPQMAFLGTMYRPAPYFVAGAMAVINVGLSLTLSETEGEPLEEGS